MSAIQLLEIDEACIGLLTYDQELYDHKLLVVVPTECHVKYCEDGCDIVPAPLMDSNKETSYRNMGTGYNQ